MHKGEFESAKRWFEKALKLGPSLDPVKCFPNFFRDVKEIQAHLWYVDGVSYVRQARFGDARTSFETWLNVFPERTPKEARDVRYDNIKVYALACDILDRLPKGTIQPSDWQTLYDYVEGANLSLPTWTLLGRLREVHARASFLSRQGPSLSDLDDYIKRLSEEWTLFLPDSPLLGEDKSAGLQRRVNLPSFLNIFDKLEKDRHNWKDLLMQNLKNLLLLMADYESKRYLNPPDDESNLPKLSNPPAPSERMTADRLAQVTLQYLERRSKQHKSIFESALSEMLDLHRAINAGDFIHPEGVPFSVEG